MTLRFPTVQRIRVDRAWDSYMTVSEVIEMKKKMLRESLPLDTVALKAINTFSNFVIFQQRDTFFLLVGYRRYSC